MSIQPEPDVPDPNGPPVLSYGTQKFRWSMLQVGVTTTLIVAAGGAVAFLALASTTVATSGALRSQRVKWEERKMEIAAAQAEGEQETPLTEQPHD